MDEPDKYEELTEVLLGTDIHRINAFFCCLQDMRNNGWHDEFLLEDLYANCRDTSVSLAWTFQPPCTECGKSDETVVPDADGIDYRNETGKPPFL